MKPQNPGAVSTRFIAASTIVGGASPVADSLFRPSAKAEHLGQPGRSLAAVKLLLARDVMDTGCCECGPQRLYCGL